MEEKTWLYKFCREYGFMTVFLFHLVTYGSALYIMVNHLIVNDIIVAQLAYGSFTMLIVPIIAMFKICSEDINIRYYDVCFSMVITRCVVYQLKHVGLTDPYWVMIFSMGMFILFTLALFLGKKYRNRHGARIARALFP